MAKRKLSDQSFLSGSRVKELDRQYERRMNEHRIHLMFSITIQSSIIATILIISRIFHKNVEFLDYLCFCCGIVINCFYKLFYFVARRKIKAYITIFSTFYFIIFSFILIEINKSGMQDPPEIFITGMILSVIISFAFLSRLKWQNCLLIIIAVNILLVYRLEVSHFGYHWDMFALGFYVSLFYVYISGRLNQKFLKDFKEVQITNRNLVWQKYLIQTILPSQIMVIAADMKKVLFKNKAVCELFNTSDDSKLIEELKKTILYNCQSNMNSDMVCTPISLVDCINKWEFSPEDFHKYHAQLKKNIESENAIAGQDSSKALFEVQIGNFENIFEETDSFILIFRDISQKGKIAELKAFDKQKDKMLATVTHDLRTPINSIVSILNIVLEMLDPSQKKIKKYVNLSIDSANSLLFLINDILDSAQIAQGKLTKLNFETFPLHKIITPVMNLLKFPAKKKGVQLGCEYSGLENRIVCVDKYRFQQILMNLVGNSLKFTDRGGEIKIEIEEIQDSEEEQCKPTNLLTSSSECNPFIFPSREASKEVLLFQYSQSSYFNIKVTDNGMGIKTQDLPRLFTAFGKLEGEQNKSGIGLGLLISQTLAKLLFPECKDPGIKVKSTFGAGSCFWFPIKVCEDIIMSECDLPEKDGEILTPSIRIQPFLSLRGGVTPSKSNNRITTRILLVDDDQINLLVLRKMVQKVGKFELETAVNGRDALNKIQSFAETNKFFDIIFMDKNMPTLGGLEASLQISQMVASAKIPKVSIYILTAEDLSNSDKQEFKGIKQFLQKPLSLADLEKHLS